MTLKTKYKAYTLSELVIVLIISSVVVGLSYSVLNMVQKQMNGIRGNLDKNTELTQFETSLQINFGKFSNINYEYLDDKLLLRNELDSITYHFRENFVVAKLDTFNTIIETKIFYFNGDVVLSGKIDALKIICDEQLQNQQLFIYKNNAADTFMN